MPAIPQANDFVAKYFLLDFDLSRIKSLQTFEISASSIDSSSHSPDEASRFCKYVLSTIRSPMFSRVEVMYEGRDFRAAGCRRRFPPRLLQLSRDEEVEEVTKHRRRFNLLREMHKVRDFESVLVAFVWESQRECVRLLKEAVEAEKARGGFGDHFPEPLVTFYPRSFL